MLLEALYSLSCLFPTFPLCLTSPFSRPSIGNVSYGPQFAPCKACLSPDFARTDLTCCTGDLERSLGFTGVDLLDEINIESSHSQEVQCWDSGLSLVMLWALQLLQTTIWKVYLCSASWGEE